MHRDLYCTRVVMKMCKWKSFLSAFCSFAISNLDAHSVRQVACDFILDVHILYGKNMYSVLEEIHQLWLQISDLLLGSLNAGI